MKIVLGAALLLGEAALLFVPGLQFAGVWMLANTLGMQMFTALVVGIAAMGAGLVMGGISDMLSHTPGSAIASRNPLAPWQVIYGTQMVGGTIVDIGETGDHDKFLHIVLITACHQTHSFQGLWLDGKQVFLSGDPLSGCSDDNSTHYDLSGMPYNFKGKVYCQAFLGGPTQSACQDYINRSNGHWTSAHTLSGRSYIYLRLQYDANVFPGGMPGVKSLWCGKTDILDPRTGQRNYSTNAALCINDFLTNKDYGVRCDTTEVNQAALIAAANLCDSYTASGTIEPLYSLNGVFNLAATPAEILNNMLSACAGQISYNAGQFTIYPSSWRGASCSIDAGDLTAPIKFKPKRKVRELYNCVRGTFLSPYGPIITRGPGVQTGQVNPWDGEWTYTDIPEYAEDVSHGYVSDAFNMADGQTLYLNTKFPFTTSVSTCQRLAKIVLERNRQQGSGTIQLSLASYGIQPLDIIEFSYPRFGWVNKLFEVSGTRLTFKSEDGAAPVPIVELDITETDPRVYSWNGAEEKNLAGQAGPIMPANYIIPAPTGLTLADDASTAVALPDGSSMARLLVSWTAPMDPFITSGGSIQIQMQFGADSNPQTTAWVDAGTVSGDANFAYINNIPSNALVSVQIRGVRAKGGTSAWVMAQRTASNVGIPQQVKNLSATESPVKTDAGMKSLVAVSFTPPAANFGSALVYFTGYNGGTNPQLMATGTGSPIQFLCDTTHEVVEVAVLAMSPNSIPADMASVPAVYLALDGVTSAPPAPTISGAQTALPDGTGWQFTLNVVGGLEHDLISGYRVYHSENAATTSPDYFKTEQQPPTNVGTITVQEVTGDLLWYWVSAISASGLESTLVAVPFQYVDPGAPPPSIASVPTTQVYKPTLLMNGWAKGAHVGYWETQNCDNGTTFGISSSQIANPYPSAASAYDGNQSTAAGFSQAHNAEYAGAVWSFNGNTLPAGATVTAASLSIVSDVLATSGISGEASIWYSTNGGSTWTQVYVQNSHNPGLGARAKQTDTVTLPISVNPATLQVMACAHSHDDIAHNVYEISLAVTQSAPCGPEKVTGVTASLVSGNVQISWNGLAPLTRSDILSYQVYRAVHGAGYTLSHLETTINSTGVATYSWADPQAHDGSFDYWVIAQNNTGYSPGSDVATLVSSGTLLYSNGKTAEDLRPLEAGAEKTTGKSLDILADGTTYKRVAANHVAAGGALQYTTGELIQNLKPAQAGADVTGSNTAANTNAVANLAAASVAGNLNGAHILSNPDFVSGLSGWNTYDNGASGHINISVVADSTTPNSSGNYLLVSYTSGASGVAPGDGGFNCGIGVDSGAATPNQYHRGATIIWRVIANIPVGYTLNWASNAYGTGGTCTALTSNAGTGAWQTFVFKQVIGTTGSFSTTGFFYMDGPGSPPNWKVAVCEAIDITAPTVIYTGNNLRSSSGMVLLDGHIITSQGTAYDTGRVNGIASSAISPISNLMPVESGAERTTGKSIDILSDGSTYARIKGAGLTNGGINYNSGIHTGQLPLSNHASAVTSTIQSGGGIDFNSSLHANKGLLATQNQVNGGNLVTNGDFEFGTLANWSGCPGFTLVHDASASGGYSVLINGGGTSVSDNFIPINTNYRYYIEMRFKDGPGSGSNFYAGFACYDANKNSIPYGPAGGTYNYTLAANVFQPQGWTVFSGIISGLELAGDHSQSPTDSASTSASKFRYGTMFIKPMGLFNYTNNAEGCYLDYFKIVQLPVVDFTDPAHVGKTLDNIGDGSSYVRVPTTIYGPSGRAVDTNGNLKLKNTKANSGVTANPSVNTSTFADLPELGTGNSAMTIALAGNPVLIGANLNFYGATGSGSSGPVIGIGTSFTSPTGQLSVSQGPPNVAITISGNGTGAGASVSWAFTQQGVGPGPSYIPYGYFTPTLSISGGQSYTSATATVTITNGSSPYSNGTVPYTCSIGASTPQSGVPIQARILMGGIPVVGPVQVTTDTKGYASLTFPLTLQFPSQTSHSFQVQAWNLNSTYTVTSTFRQFQLVELG